jgi:hypothetical protein
MTGRVRTERLLDIYLAPEADRLPDGVLDAALDQIAVTGQRRALRVSWGHFRANPGLRLAATAIAAIVVLGGLLSVIGPQRFGTGPIPTPAVSPSIAATASPAPTPVDPSGWTPFVSDRHGITFRVPPGWSLVKATGPWIWQPADPGPSNAAADRAVGPQNQAFVVASQRLPAGMSEDEWWVDYLSADTTGMPAGCFPATRAGYEPVDVSGKPGFLHGGLGQCNFTEVIVVVEGRAYQLTAYVNLTVPNGLRFDRAVFDAWLSTVTFDPASADDTPVEASPTPT